MILNNFDQTELEDAVSELLRAASIAKKVYNNRPASATTDLSDFIVCKVSGSIRDRYAIGQCTLAVHLFAKDNANFKNGKKLSVMQQKTIAAVPRSLDRFIIDGTPNILGDTDDGNGYHVRIINYKVTIKVAE